MAPCYRSQACQLAALRLDAEGAVRVAPVMGLPRMMADLGLDADACLRAQGCDPGLFADPDNVIEFRAIGRLLDDIAKTTECLYPGLEIGRRGGLEVAGVVGRAVSVAPDLGTALRALSLYLHLHDRGASPYLWTGGHQAMFGYTLYCADLVGTDQIHDGAIAIACNMIRELVGQDWQPTEIRLFRERPAHVGPFGEHFRAPLRFGSSQAAIVFPIADLQHPCIGADVEGYARALAELEAMDVALGVGLSDKVSRVLRRMLITLVSAGEPIPDRAAIAQLFALHPRTLNRRLRAEGASFSTLLAHARYDIARQLLRDTHLPVQDIASVLGYAGTGPFNHAFRQWSGTTPSCWRTQRSPK
jgi:AraC-like DNA-binding protein